MVEMNIPEYANNTIKVYESNIKQAKALADAYGFDIYFFWQPILFSGSRNELAYEKAIIDNHSPVFIKTWEQLYLIARESLSGREDENIYFLGNILDNFDEPAYTDWCHTGPRANRVIAKEMYRNIEKDM